MLARAHLGEHARVRRQLDAHQVQLLAAVDVVLEEAADRDLLGGFRGLARQPQHLRDRVADRPQATRPVLELTAAIGRRQV